MPRPRSKERHGWRADIPDGLTHDYEAEVLPGLAGFAAAELVRTGAMIVRESEAALGFEYRGEPTALSGLRRCVAVFALLRFDVPRPKALLGHAHLTRVIAQIDRIRSSAADFRGFRFGAAGSQSPVFRRLAEAITAATGLAHESEEGELLLRVRPASDGGWEVLVRLTPRPLSARAWRACNRPGGLNATVAAAAHDLLGVASHDRYLNLMCGSGTLAIERALAAPWRTGVALDVDPGALDCAAENVELAGVAGRLRLLRADATAIPLDDGSFDRLAVDLPWGDAVGEHRDNAVLYPSFLVEAARVASPAARMLAITHELRLLEGALAAQAAWRVERVVRVYHGGHRPGMYLLARGG